MRLTCSAPNQVEIGVGMPLSAGRFGENVSVDAKITMELFFESTWSYQTIVEDLRNVLFRSERDRNFIAIFEFIWKF